MVLLSVNLNKVATLRNSRGGDEPSVMHAAEVCMGAGAGGLTVHPRADARHIRPDDVSRLAERLQRSDAAHVELNIEGDPRPEWLAMVHAARPTQATLVPVRPGELTSEAGWPAEANVADVVGDLQVRGIRVSVFIDPTPSAVAWAKRMGADRVELYTEPFAAAFARGAGEAAMAPYVEAAEAAAAAGLGVNAGHDLNLDNLVLFRRLPHLNEVSIGHALMARAMFQGMAPVVAEYLDVLRG